MTYLGDNVAGKNRVKQPSIFLNDLPCIIFRTLANSLAAGTVQASDIDIYTYISISLAFLNVFV